MRTSITSLIPLAVLIAVLASCRPSIAGHWANDDQDVAYHFRGDGQVTITALGSRATARYRVIDDQVIVTGPQGTVVLTLDDNELVGPMAQRFVKQPVARR